MPAGPCNTRSRRNACARYPRCRIRLHLCSSFQTGARSASASSRSSLIALVLSSTSFPRSRWAVCCKRREGQGVAKKMRSRKRASSRAFATAPASPTTSTSCRATSTLRSTICSSSTLTPLPPSLSRPRPLPRPPPRARARASRRASPLRVRAVPWPLPPPPPLARARAPFYASPQHRARSRRGLVRFRRRLGRGRRADLLHHHHGPVNSLKQRYFHIARTLSPAAANAQH